jgi:Kef-type K+ transport system membrane component KefB
MDERNVDIEERRVEHKSDSSLVLSTFIKYAAFLIIFFGILYFIVKYIFPWFK